MLLLRSRLTPLNDTVSIVQVAEWAPGQVWTRAENLVPTGIRFTDRPALGESLYRLSYPGPKPKYSMSENLKLLTTKPTVGHKSLAFKHACNLTGGAVLLECYSWVVRRQR